MLQLSANIRYIFSVFYSIKDFFLNRLTFFLHTLVYNYTNNSCVALRRPSLELIERKTEGNSESITAIMNNTFSRDSKYYIRIFPPILLINVSSIQ